MIKSSKHEDMLTAHDFEDLIPTMPVKQHAASAHAQQTRTNETSQHQICHKNYTVQNIIRYTFTASKKILKHQSKYKFFNSNYKSQRKTKKTKKT